MKKPIRALAGSSLMLALAAASPVHAQSQARPEMQAERSGTLSGTVAEVFGNSFVLQHQGGRVLVEAGPRSGQRLSLRQGESISVTGSVEDGRVEATQITRADGTTTRIRNEQGPPPWAGGRGAEGRSGRDDDGDRGRMGESRRGEAMSWSQAARLVDEIERRGYTDIREVEVKRRHVEVEARDSRGRSVEVHADLDGRIRED